MEQDDIDDEISAIAAEYGRDESDVRAKYDEKLDYIKSTDVIGVDDYERAALNTTRSYFQRKKRAGEASGEVEEVPVLAIGNYGVFTGWGDDDDSVMIGVGVAAPEDTEDENRVPGLTAFVMKESVGMDLGKARQLWQWGNHIRGWFVVDTFDEEFAARDRSYYLADSTSESRMEEADFSGSLPSEPDKIREFLNNNFVLESFTLQNVADNVSREGDEFGANWLDLRRIEAQVVDTFRRDPEDCDADENPFGKYAVIDDSVASAEELAGNRDVVTDDDVDSGRQLGLQVFCSPEKVKYGEDSTLELYGTVGRNPETGQHTMRAAGVAPVIPFPRESDDEGGDAEDVETDVIN